MALDPKYMIAPPLNEYFVDKDTGFPLAGGVISFYSDVNRTTLKPVYQLTGVPPYSGSIYTALPNPLTLSSAGTLVDSFGNQVILYYYPFDANGNIELYYITIYSAGGVLQKTIQAWPNFVESNASSADFTNFIPNGQFLLHNNIPAYNGIVGQAYALGQVRALDTNIASGNWSFDRSSNSSTDFVVFKPFGSYVTNPSSSPRYYVEISCTSPNRGDTIKDLRINFPDVNKFASDTQEYTFAFTAKSNSGSSLTGVELIVRKNFGSGGSDPTENVIQTVPAITTSYTVIQQSFTFGNNTGKTIGTGGDDTVSLVVRFPATSTFDVSLTDFVLTINAVNVTVFPTTTEAQFMSTALTAIPPPDPNGFDMYCPLVQTPQGLKFSRSEIGMVVPNVTSASSITGYLLCDGTTYEAQAYSADSIPYARLQSVILSTSGGVSRYYPLYGTGVNYVMATQSSTVAPNSAQVMISTNNSNVVTNSADGSVPTNFGIRNVNAGINNFGFTAYPASTPNNATPYVLVVQNNYYVSVTNPTAGTSGFTIVYYGTDSGLPLSYQTFAVFPTLPNPITNLAGKYFTFSLAAGSPTAYYVWFQVDGTGADPAPGGTGILVNISASFSYQDVVNAISYALSGNQTTLLATLTAGSSITPGAYFTFNTSTAAYYVWFQVNGAGTDPAPVNRFPILVSVNSTDNIGQVSTAITTAINSKFYAVPDLRGVTIKGASGSASNVIEDDATRRYTLFKQADPGGTGPGTWQLDSNNLHNHTATTTTTLSNEGLGVIVDIGSGGSAQGSAGSLWIAQTVSATSSTSIANAGALRTNVFNVAMQYFIKY